MLTVLPTPRSSSTRETFVFSEVHKMYLPKLYPPTKMSTPGSPRRFDVHNSVESLVGVVGQ